MSIEKKDIADIELAARLDRIERRLLHLEVYERANKYEVGYHDGLPTSFKEFLPDGWNKAGEVGTATIAPNSFGSIITAKGNLRKGK